VSRHQEQIFQAAQGKVPEQLLGATFAKPRGATTAAVTGGVAGAIGSKWAGRQHSGAGAVGIQLGNPGAVAVTPTSLVTMAVGVSFSGQINEVKEVLSVVPLATVDSVEVKRMGLAGVMVITVAGTSFKLEGKVPDMREFAAAFARAKGTAS
jgi:hypothetical protein